MTRTCDLEGTGLGWWRDTAVVVELGERKDSKLKIVYDRK
jgi:hypothetical protein